jgi:hypothetical protein
VAKRRRIVGLGALEIREQHLLDLGRERLVDEEDVDLDLEPERTVVEVRSKNCGYALASG